MSEMVNRAVQKELTKPKFDMHSQVPQDNPSYQISPETAALLGGMVDAGSTYSFLKRGTGTEGNPILSPFHNHPLGTAAGVMGMAYGGKLLRDLLRKKSPGLADALAGNMGAAQMGTGLTNMTTQPIGSDSEAIVTNTLGNYYSGGKR